MSLAETLIAKGRVEGRVEGIEKGIEKGRSQGYWMGRIQTLEEFLDLPQSSQELLNTMDLAELEARHQQLHREYQRRFK
jgi:flagellar biosynthesis/type III secretory pathway protein FliH